MSDQMYFKCDHCGKFYKAWKNGGITVEVCHEDESDAEWRFHSYECLLEWVKNQSTEEGIPGTKRFTRD